MKDITRFGGIGLAAVALAAFIVWVPGARGEVPSGPPTFTNPLDFSNDFFPFEAGAMKVYRGKSDGERIVVVDVYDAETRTFSWNGGTVEARQLREVEFEEGTLVEVSFNYFAHADDGTVYYFGEVVDDYEDGAIVSHEGSWLVGGPLGSDPPETATATDPTVFMPANPDVGDEFKPEDLLPFVDETVTVLALDGKLKVEAGKFEGVMKVRETSQLSTGSEKKWYASGVGFVKAKSADEELELIAYSLPPVDV